MSSERSGQPKRHRALRFFLILLAFGAVTGLLALGAIKGYLWLVGERSLLSELEWQRLRVRIRSSVVSSSEVPTAPTPEGLDLGELVPEVAAPTRRERVELSAEQLEAQLEAYRADRPKSIVELQPFRHVETMEISTANGSKATATLVNINPRINSWYLLLLREDGGSESAHHLVNAEPLRQDLTLDPEYPEGLTLVDTLGERRCPLWSDELAEAASSSSPYAPLCGGEVTLRLVTPGRRTTLEWATDFLRDNVWRGEAITSFVREKLFQDAYIETTELVEDENVEVPAVAANGVPRPARLDERYVDSAVVSDELGLTPERASQGMMAVGRWYRAQAQAGVYISVVQPGIVAPALLDSHRDVVSRLDEVERDALVYLIAFDLDELEIGFALGTEHPRTGWSARVLDSVRNASLPGPDGIDTTAPIVTTGIVPRADAERTVATFTGGFKRDHGAFRVSELATRNYGSHYGFIESGAILSKLQPGLATFFVLADGSVGMKSWTEEDDALLADIVFARQNGLPIVEPGPDGGAAVPGSRVSQWAAGNWSGSQDKKFRTVRAAAALQQSGDTRFLIYAYFSSATPSAMVRVFQAYECEYAMMLDMNALEHTYLALYTARDDVFGVEHLVRGMEVLDKSIDDQIVPRFLGFADNRDFFYVLRKQPEALDVSMEVAP